MDSFTVNEFDGGLDDNYLSAPKNSYAYCDNLLIDKNKKLYVRDGFEVFGTRLPAAVANAWPSGIYIGSTPYDLPVVFRGNAAYYMTESDTWTEITGPEDNVAIPNKTNTSLESASLWRKQIIYGSGPSTVLPHRIYCDSTSPSTSFLALTLGLPAITITPTPVPGTVGTSKTYVYSLHYYYQFTDADGVVYEEKGPVLSLTAQAGAAINAGAANTITIPLTALALVNTSSTNYDVTNVKIRICRTITDGTTSYFVADVTNGTTSYADTTPDTTIQDNDVIYTDGGVLEYGQPPVGAKFVTSVNDIFFWATDTVITQSIQGSPGSVPADYETPVDQKVKGLASLVGFPVLYCDRKVYRVDGIFDELGGGGFSLIEIDHVAGCYSNRSVVNIPNGIVWAGNGGFYFTDGYKVLKISEGIDDFYKIWKNGNMVGVYDSIRNQVRWTASTSPDSEAANDQIVVLHLKYGLSERSVFTTESSVNNIFPICLAYTESLDTDSRFRNSILVGESRGYFLYSKFNTKTDPAIDFRADIEDWKKKAIIYRYESPGFDLGADSSRAYCSLLVAQLSNETDCAMQFFTRRDDGGPWQSFSEFKVDGAIVWGRSDYPWDGSADDVLHPFDSQKVIEGQRYFPKNQLRSTRRQIAFTNSKTWVAKSDDQGTITTNPTTKTITLNTVTSFWPDDCEDYFIYLSSDSYTYGYKVKSKDSARVVTVYDPYGTLPAGSTIKWQLKGYRKFEKMRLLSYQVKFDVEEDTGTPSAGTVGQVNA